MRIFVLCRKTTNYNIPRNNDIGTYFPGHYAFREFSLEDFHKHYSFARFYIVCDEQNIITDVVENYPLKINFLHDKTTDECFLIKENSSFYYNRRRDYNILTTQDYNILSTGEYEVCIKDLSKYQELYDVLHVGETLNLFKQSILLQSEHFMEKIRKFIHIYDKYYTKEKEADFFMKLNEIASEYISIDLFHPQREEKIQELEKSFNSYVEDILS